MAACTLPTHNLSATGFGLLAARRRHEHALLAATGPSVGRLTAGQCGFLQARMDVWATNQFFLHHYLVPDFYHLEVRVLPLSRPKGSTRRGPPAVIKSEIIWRLFDANASKRRAYRKTVFLARSVAAKGPFAPNEGSSVERLLRRSAPCPRALVTYFAKNRGSCEHLTERLRSTVESQFLERRVSSPVYEHCASSITRIIDVMLRLGYKTASLIGVDLTSTDHFYTAIAEYADVARRLPDQWETTVRAFVRAHNQNTTLHATGARGVARYFDAFNLAHRRHGRMRLVNLSPMSLLNTSRRVPTSPPPRDGLEDWWRRTYLTYDETVCSSSKRWPACMAPFHFHTRAAHML